MLNNVCAVVVAVISACWCAPAPAQTLEAVVAAIRVGAVDVDEAAAFYREHLGCVLVVDAKEDGFVVLSNGGVMIVITPTEKPVVVGDGDCGTVINFQTADLDATTASLRAAGVKVVGKGESAVGPYVKFLDPSGNLLHMKQVSRDDPGDSIEANSELPSVYNVGIKVKSMGRAVGFYEGLFGFIPLTSEYYPPVIPMTKRGNVSFILSDAGGSESPYDDRGVAFVGLAFEVPDVASAMKILAAKGVRVLDETPRQAGNVIHAAFRDPFGNVHELIQHVAPDASSARDTNEADESNPDVVSIDDLSWLEGVWRSGSDGDVLEETWSAADGDAMIGMFRWSRGGHVWLYELMAIEQDEDGIVFRLRHFSRGLTPWKSEADEPLTYPLRSASDSEVVFENPKREQPRRFVYRREGRTLVIRIEAPDGSGDEFRLERVDR